jgi:hypothetical protein
VNWGLLAGADEGGATFFLFGGQHQLFIFGVVLELIVFELFLLLLFQFHDAFLELFRDDGCVGDFCGAEVDEFEVAVAVKHHVFWLCNSAFTLMSRWVMPLEWRYSSRLTISAM